MPSVRTSDYGANTFSYMWSCSANECVRRLAGWGFNEFELMTMPGHIWPDELSVADAVSLRSQWNDLGLKIRSLNHTGVDQNLSSPVEAVREYTTGLLAKLIRLAAQLGAPNVVILPGRINPLLPAEPERHREWTYLSIKKLIPLAEDAGVRLAIENIPVGPVPTVGEVIELVRRLESPAARICYDVANAHFAGEDPAMGLKLVAPWLDIVHLSDTGQDRWRHDAIGEGTVNFISVLQALRICGHASKPLLELAVVEPDQGHRASLEKLSQIQSA